MSAADYIQSTEQVYAQTEAKKDPSSTSGTLAVTDSRLIFAQEFYFSDNRFLDIGLNHIDEIRYYENRINYQYLFFAFTISVIALFSWSVGPSIFSNLQDVNQFFLVIGGILVVSLVYSAIFPRSDQLIVSTTNDTHTFRSGNLEKFPHAIRGNS